MDFDLPSPVLEIKYQRISKKKLLFFYNNSDFINPIYIIFHISFTKFEPMSFHRESKLIISCTRSIVQKKKQNLGTNFC
jgi:hypothetical protein